MGRQLRVLSLCLLAVLSGADVVAQDTNPPATTPTRTPRQRPKPQDPNQPAENPDEKKDEQPPADSKPGEKKPGEDKPADNKPDQKPADGKSPATKQPAKPASKPSTPAKPQPTAPARPVIQAVEVEFSEPGPYVKREKPREWNVTINVDVRAQSNSTDLIEKLVEPDTRTFKFETLSVVFPLPPATASATPDRSTLKALLRLQNAPVLPAAVTVLDKQITGQPYQSGVSLIRLDAVNGVCQDISFEITYKSTAANTVYAEAEAQKVKWPKNGWPTVLASTFEPQMFVDYAVVRDNVSVIRRPMVSDAMVQWVNEQTKNNPQSVPPATLAKWLAGQLMMKLQPSGDGLSFLNNGQLQGMMILGPEATFRTGRGSDFDIAATLVAVYRQAGLPARLVIGWDTGTGGDNDEDFLGRAAGKGKKTLKPWVEWALYDEEKATVNWVPVDLAKMRKQGSRAQPMDRAWKYFGTHDELQGVVPIALHFHPPTTVESYGAPAMWGWMMTPQPPEVAFQSLRFRADRPSMTVEDQKKKQNENKNKK
ncbi:MAG: transglutaminase domain-containing protein [Phycisphaerales bacterium]